MFVQNAEPSHAAAYKYAQFFNMADMKHLLSSRPCPGFELTGSAKLRGHSVRPTTVECFDCERTLASQDTTLQKFTKTVSRNEMRVARDVQKLEQKPVMSDFQGRINQPADCDADGGNDSSINTAVL